ncbi:MAG: NAD(P)-dependent oxidoreductase, partial [Algoriphagus sp.]
MNHLYPIFLKVHELNILLVGGGYVATEKLEFLLKSSPEAQVTVISPMFRPEFIAMAGKTDTVTLIEDRYHEKYLGGKHLVIG